MPGAASKGRSGSQVTCWVSTVAQGLSALVDSGSAYPEGTESRLVQPEAQRETLITLEWIWRGFQIVDMAVTITEITVTFLQVKETEWNDKVIKMPVSGTICNTWLQLFSISTQGLDVHTATSSRMSSTRCTAALVCAKTKPNSMLLGWYRCPLIKTGQLQNTKPDCWGNSGIGYTVLVSHQNLSFTLLFIETMSWYE